MVKVIDGVCPTTQNPRARKYGEFGLTIQLEPAEFIKLKWALTFEPHIELAFGYFTPQHLEEAFFNDGICQLTAYWEKGAGQSRNDGEIWDDLKWLENWLNRALWHGFQHDLGLGLMVTHYKPLCDKVADEEIHPDDVPDLDTDDYWLEYRQEPGNFIHCTFYPFDSDFPLRDEPYETITNSLGIEWCEDPDYEDCSNPWHPMNRSRTYDQTIQYLGIERDLLESWNRLQAERENNEEKACTTNQPTSSGATATESTTPTSTMRSHRMATSDKCAPISVGAR